MRLIDADELLERLKDVKDGYAELIEYGVELAMDEITDMIEDGEYVSDVVSIEYHNKCMELEIRKRFDLEKELANHEQSND